MNNRDLMAMDKFFGDIFNVAGQINDGSFIDYKRLHVDWDSNEDGYIVKAELPGLEQDKVDVNIENGVITIKAEYGEDSLRSGKYKWAARVQDIETDKVEAELKNGVLTVTLPKSEKAKPKKIKVA